MIVFNYKAIKRIKKNRKKTDKTEKYFTQYTVDQRLKIIADLIINRLIEKKDGGDGNFNQM